MLIHDRHDLSTKQAITEEGFLVVPAKIARTGLQDYHAFELGLTDLDPEAIVKVFRSDAEVFNPDSLKSFGHKPVTDNHPGVMLDATNTRNFQIGFSAGDVVKDGDFVSTTLHITDGMAIEKVQAGKVELSNGYTCDFDRTPGKTKDGESFDAVQTNIRGNHIALVDKGRCGGACKIADKKTTIEANDMEKVSVGGTEFEVSENLAKAIGMLISSMTSSGDGEKETDADDPKEESTDQEEEKEEEDQGESKEANDKLQAKLDHALSRIPSAKALDALVKVRLDVITKAQAIDDKYVWEDKSIEQICKEIVQAQCNDVDIEKVSTEYIKARFDALSTNQAEPSGSLADAIKASLSKSDNKVQSIVDDARKRMIERNKNAWKPKGAA